MYHAISLEILNQSELKISCSTLIQINMGLSNFPDLCKFGLVVGMIFVLSFAYQLSILNSERGNLKIALNFESLGECNCKSLFTIGGCNIDKFAGEATGPRWWKKALLDLGLARRGNSKGINENLHTLSRYLPNHHYSDKGRSNEQKDIEEYPFIKPNSSNLFTKMSDPEAVKYFERNWLMNHIPHVPCNIHIYNHSEIQICLRKRRQKYKRKLLISFIGDSLVRTLLEHIVINLRETLDLRNAEANGKNLTTDFLDQASKIDWPVTGDDIEMRLHWSTAIGKTRQNFTTTQGAFDVFETWAKGLSSEGVEDVPDIIYFDSGLWRDKSRYETDSIERMHLDLDKIAPFLKKLPNTRLIYRMQTTFKEWLAQNLLETGRVEYVNQISWLTFEKIGVWLWDSVTPFYLKEIDECRNHWRTGFANNLPQAWNCGNFQHPSYTVESVAVNMLWNYVCNEVMEVEPGSCCADI